MYKAYQFSFNIEKYFIFRKTTHISMFHVTFFLILYFDWLLGPHKGKDFEKHLKIFSEIVYSVKPALCIHVPDSSLYIICVFYFSRIRNLVAMAT